MVVSDFLSAFVLGLLTPLTAVCVLPLYPGFLVYLATRVTNKESRGSIFFFGLIVSFGVILSMSILGLIVTTFLQESLTTVIGVVSPIAFIILSIISLLLILDVDFAKFFPNYHPPLAKNPYLSAFLFGFFFGAIVVPCNPLFIAALFTRTLLVTDFIINVFTFAFFGLGIAFPLLVFAGLSSTASTTIIGFLTRYTKHIKIISGVIMLAISLYYLIFVFRVFGG